MADIFISYAKKHARLTEELARDLEAEGFTTWWDTSLLPGDEFPEQIKNEIDAAQAVIVIWTDSSVASPWVRAEANRAYGHGKLITLRAAELNLEQVPLPFNTLQSSLVTDRARVFSALARRGVRPSGYVSFREVRKIEIETPRAADKSASPLADSDAPASAAQEWAQLKEIPDVGKLRIFAKHFAGAYYADLAQELISELEEKPEEDAWRLVFSKRDIKLAKSFLERFPNSRHAVDVAKRIDMLERRDKRVTKIDIILKVAAFPVLIVTLIIFFSISHYVEPLNIYKGVMLSFGFIFLWFIGMVIFGSVLFVIFQDGTLEQDIASQERLHGIESTSDAK
jgi:hypothetical protein